MQPHPWRPESRTTAAKAAEVLEADTSKATDNSDFRRAAVNAADVIEAATLKKLIGLLTDDTSKKEIEAEALKKPPGNLTA